MKMPIRFSILAALAFIAVPALQAAALTEAKITYIVKDVRTVASGKAPVPASLNELVDGRKSVRTGIESRTELLFNDQTITRIGANSHFTFADGSRDISLSKGVILRQVPKGAGGARIQTAAVTAAITGTTVLIEAGRWFTKLIVLEGKSLVSFNADLLHRKHEVTAGYEIIIDNKTGKVIALFEVDLNTIMRTSCLLVGRWGVQLELKRIAAAIAVQLRQGFAVNNIATIGPGTKTAYLGELPANTKVQGIIQPPPSPIPIPFPNTSTNTNTPTQPTNPGQPGGNTPNPGQPGGSKP